MVLKKKLKKLVTKEKGGYFFPTISSLCLLICLYIYDKYKFDYENINRLVCIYIYIKLNIYAYKQFDRKYVYKFENQNSYVMIKGFFFRTFLQCLFVKGLLNNFKLFILKLDFHLPVSINLSLT